MIARLGTQRIEIGNQVTAHAISVNQLKYRSHLRGIGKTGFTARDHRTAAIRFPAHGLVRHFQVRKNPFIELIAALQQLLNFRQEHAGFRALNDAVIVGARHRHHFAQAERGAHFRRDALILGRIVDGAGCDDAALSRHQARHRGNRSHRARVRQRNARALKILQREFALASTLDDVVESREVLLKISRAGVLQIRDHECAIAVLAGHIHREAKVDLTPHQPKCLAVFFGVRVVERRVRLQRLNNRPANNMGVRNLTLAC